MVFFVIKMPTENRFERHKIMFEQEVAVDGEYMYVLFRCEKIVHITETLVNLVLFLFKDTPKGLTIVKRCTQEYRRIIIMLLFGFF